ncbi:hypothetical protein GCM10023094_55010 [Rhodococcus olei]|uniref:4Fe-4S Wbl-type domain-containing protein n=1 Tax=Rhodococcus olei TaxID=2161675 RepID=A0ABP8PQ37_9NOCA
MNTLVGTGALRLTTARSHAGTKPATRDRIADAQRRAVLAHHLPNRDSTSCTVCSFVYTTKHPLCPAVADALRELSDGRGRPNSSWQPLAGHSTERLHTMAREHTGEGRCRRCGFIYSGQVRTCPPARRIAALLEARGKTPLTQDRAGQGLCAGKAEGWLVTGNEPAPWKRAMAACTVCPLLEKCEESLNARLAAGEKISEQVHAGRLFTTTGREVAPADIDQFAVNRGRTKKEKKTAAVSAPAPTLVTAPRQLALFEKVAA